MQDHEYHEIAPYHDSDFHKYMAELVDEQGFEHAVKYVMPMVDYPEFKRKLLSLTSKEVFQIEVMKPFLKMLVNKTSAALTSDGFDKCVPQSPCTYMSNHRDIVLDASFLNLVLIENHIPTCEIALGDNLLVYPWIEHLVKLNKGFIVKRNLKLLKAFEAAKQLSGYIRHAIRDKKESIWIAQREGRAKDSNDRTQESVLKMLVLGEHDSVIDALTELHIAPLTISYEFDPNDYLKAKEYLLKKLDPEYKKSQHDDLLSMETGLLGYKGRIHYHLSDTIDRQLDTLRGITDKNELFAAVAALIDRAIHRGYKLYPINYISYDRLNGTDLYSSNYTDEDVAATDKYLDGQMAKIDIELDDDKRRYLMHMMLTMYANPLINKLAAEKA